ncbi:MAG TPA: FtsX-like permease family protein [Vicinamibacterales bacterium]|jgi:ABC-type lipoprotein release transport system permease subunit|nr:FtsX-like permease family protein [Vicinamibacterales bacterium]
MTIAKLALRNFLGAGMKAWLRVVVLSLAFVVIIGLQGLYVGMGEQMSQAMISAELGGGQYWHPKYDPQDPLELADAHGPIPAGLTSLIESGRATPILIVQGYIYSAGTFRSILLKGIDPNQHVLSLPTDVLADSPGSGPALIGTRMAREAGLKVADVATVRWRDAVGTFDAEEIRIARVMNTSVQTVDSGQVWLPLDRLQRMARMNGEASLVVLANGTSGGAVTGWTFKNLDFLLADVRAMVRTKMAGGAIVYTILLFLGMITILDTQVLSIFYRKKEIGTLMALGLTRGSVIRMFTLEGAFNAVLAAVIGAIYGIPLLGLLANSGIPLPPVTEQVGFSVGDRIYPAYSAALVLGTTALVGVTTTVVSFLPTRKIARLQPTEALRGRLG